MVDENNTSPGPNNKIALIAGAVALVAIILLLIWVFSSDEPEQQPQSTPPVVTQQPDSSPEPEPAPEPEPEPVEEAPEPVEPVEPEEPLPSLAESDDQVLEELGEASNSDQVRQYVTHENVLLKSVRAISALEEGALVNKYRPIAGPDQAFQAELVDDENLEDDEPIKYRMTQTTYSRYDDHVNTLVQMDVGQIAELYNRWYPLMEQAYQEQGVDKGSFREVTLRAIDQLLQAPIIEEDILLVQPSVMFKYADPSLEALPGGHKLMLRLGPDNARKVKNVLRHLRAELE